MEKFAVDLDKVLDELEFNEDRAENFVATGERHHITSVSPSISQDHAAATHVSFESGDSGSKWRPKPVPLSQKTSVSGVFSSLNEYLNSGRVKSPPSGSGNGVGDLCSTVQLAGPCSEVPAWSPPVSSDGTSIEEKPDLIDSSVLHPSTSETNQGTKGTEDRKSSQGIFLPDIATAGTLGKPNPIVREDASSSLDLISHKSNPPDADSVDPVQKEITNANLLSHKNVLSFNTLDVNPAINEDELNDYLSDLESEEEQEEHLNQLSCPNSASCFNPNQHSSKNESQNGFQLKTQVCSEQQLQSQGVGIDNADATLTGAVEATSTDSADATSMNAADTTTMEAADAIAAEASNAAAIEDADVTTAETVDTSSTGTVDTTSKGTVDTTSKGTVDTTSTGTVNTTSTGTVDTTSKGTVDTTSTGTVDTTSSGTVDTTSTECSNAAATEAEHSTKSTLDDVSLQKDSKSISLNLPCTTKTDESDQIKTFPNDYFHKVSVEESGQDNMVPAFLNDEEVTGTLFHSGSESPPQVPGVFGGEPFEAISEIQGTEELKKMSQVSSSDQLEVSSSHSANSENSLEMESPAVGQPNIAYVNSLLHIPNSTSNLLSEDDNNNDASVELHLENNVVALQEESYVLTDPNVEDDAGSIPSENCIEYVTSSSDQKRNVQLSLCVTKTDMPSNCSSPATPPTVPVTPTFEDPPVLEEYQSTVSTSSTPFLTPVAVISESSEFHDKDNAEEAVLRLPSSSTASATSAAETQSSAVCSDPCQKPVRPSSLEIPVRTEPAQTETTGSSEDSPVAFNATVGPPGATPSANKPSMVEALTEPQGTDESATESSASVEEAASGPVGGEESTSGALEESLLGREPPFWVPDADAPCCMQCDFKFTVLKRRHHCRACGKVLCSKCCSEKAHLEYINAEARVCVSCKSILVSVGVGSPTSPPTSNLHPNPNNPMEYCSTVPPLLQISGSSHSQTTPTVMVPVGVLKREGSAKPKSEPKQVMFSDGIRPGADLAELDGSSEPRLSIRRTGRTSKRVGTPPGNASTSQRTLLPIDGTTLSYVPHGKGLPPVVIRGKDGVQFEEDPDPTRLLAVIRDDSAPPVKFTINRNLFVLVKMLNLDCCVNRVCWCFTSDGLGSVGQDEIVIILEVEPEEMSVPKDIFNHLNTLYMEAAKGNTVTEMGHTLTRASPFLGSREHGGFLYVRPTFQCLHRLILPPAPYLVGVLIHRWETPWARIFPIRLMLRLGAEFRYYPCPLVSIRQRSSVYGEIGHTIIQLLADFRNMAYTLPTVRGLVIHMEDKQTTILMPRNRYDQVMRALNNSDDHVLAFGANFSQIADSHLVCMQTDSDHSYHTQAINIHNKPRKVTGASFVVFNGALKVSCGMAAKSTIVEDGLMVKVTSETMASLKTSLRDMKDLSITCGPINPSSEVSTAGAGILSSDEVVLIKWAEDDRSFNIGVLSSVDGRPLDGVPSIRVHNGTDYHGEYRFIRWTEVFILESEEGSGRTGDPVDISRLSEQLAKATCLALVKLLDLLAAANLTTLAVRATIHPENVGYLAGSNGEKLPPIYMKSLDDELVPVLHEAGVMSGESPAVLELVFRIMESG